MYMAGMTEEEAFDSIADQMELKGYGSRVCCPTLLVTGEFDPLSPVEAALEFYRELSGPKELWVLENEFHRVWAMEGLGGLDLNPYAVDWLRAALEGRFKAGYQKTVYVRQKIGRGPFDSALPQVYPGRW